MKQKIFAVLTVAALLLGSAIVAKTAVNTIAGLAVAQSSTVWNSVKDASVGDNLTNGVLVSQLYFFDGTDFDRARGDTTFGLDVDVTRMPGSGQTPADGFANPTTFSGAWSLGGLFNGTTWDRIRSSSGTNNTATTSTGAMQVAQLSTWSVTNTVNAAVTAASASKALGGGTVRHVATGITFCYSDTVLGRHTPHNGRHYGIPAQLGESSSRGPHHHRSAPRRALGEVITPEGRCNIRSSGSPFI
jgi:hypothetical protein